MSLKYWEYFLSLEDDLEKCTKFIEFDTRNYNTFSIELAKIIISASAEFENVAKDLCKLIDPTSSPKNIIDIYPILFQEFPKFCDIEITIPRYKLQFKPWDQWTSSKRPDWWANGYNKIKHSRDTSFHLANLQNAIHAMGALFSGILYFHEKLSGGIHVDYSRAPSLFDIIEEPTGIQNGGISLHYQLP